MQGHLPARCRRGAPKRPSHGGLGADKNRDHKETRVDKLSVMNAFFRIVERGSFVRAAEDLAYRRR